MLGEVDAQDWMVRAIKPDDGNGGHVGTAYWRRAIDFDALIRNEMIDPEDTALFHRTDSMDDTFQFITKRLEQYAMTERGAIL